MSFKGVFFDLYGTLLVYGDMSAAWDHWLSALYEHLVVCGLSMPKASFATHCDGFMGRPEPPFQDDGLTIYERRIRLLGAELGLDLEREVLEKAAEATISAWHRYTHLDPDALPLLRALNSEKTLALVSNFDHPPHVHGLLSELALAEFFDAIVVSGDVGVKKPDPHIFSFVLEPAGLSPKDVLYVGDAPEDVQGARAAVIFPVQIQRRRFDRAAMDFEAEQELRVVEEANEAGARTIFRLPELVGIARGDL